MSEQDMDRALVEELMELEESSRPRSDRERFIEEIQEGEEEEGRVVEELPEDDHIKED
jgi:hypothetical protein